jgi:hypothetical protein
MPRERLPAKIRSLHFPEAPLWFVHAMMASAPGRHKYSVQPKPTQRMLRSE